LREFQGLARSAQSGSAPSELPWDQLYVRDGSLDIETIYGGDALGELQVKGLDAVPGQMADTMMLDASMVKVRIGDVTQTATAVHLPDLVVSPARIRAPQVSLSFPELSVDGSLDVVPDGPIRGLFTVQTTLSTWSPLLPGRVSLTGDIAVDVELSGMTRSPVLSGEVLMPGLALDVQPATPGSALSESKHYALGDIQASWRLRDRQILFDPLDADWASGAVHITGAIDLASKGVWASISAKDLSLGAALRALNVSADPWVDAEMDLEIQAAGTVVPLRMAGSYSLATAGLTASIGPVSHTPLLIALPRLNMRGSLDVNGRGIELGARPLLTARSKGSVHAHLGFGSLGPLSVDFSFDPIDLRELAPLADLGLAGRGHLRGWLGGPLNDLSAKATLNVAGLRLWGLPVADQIGSEVRWIDGTRLLFPDIRGTRGETSIKSSVALDFRGGTSLDLQLLVPNGRLEDLTAIFLDLPGVTASLQGSLELQGPIGALDGESRIELSDVELFGEHFDKGQATGWMDAGRFTLDGLAIWRAGGEESVIARGSVGAGWAANLDIHASGLRLERMDRLKSLDRRLQGTLSLDMTVGGTLTQPEPRGLLRLHDARFARALLPDSALSFATRDGVLFFGGNLVSGGAAPDRATLQGALNKAAAAAPGLHLGGQLGLWDDQPYRIDASLKDFPLSLLYSSAPDGSPIAASLSGQATVSGAFGEQPTPVAVVARFDDTRLSWGRHRLAATQPWTWKQTGEDFAVDGLTLAGGQTSLSFSGQRLRDGPTRFAGTGQVDLDLLRMVVPGLERSDGVGQVDVHAVSLDGRLRPEMIFAADGLSLRGDWFPGTFEDLSLRLRGNPDTITIESAKGRLGGGTVTVSGTIDTRKFLPHHYDLHASASDVSVRYFDFLPPVQGDAQLRFSGPADSPLLSGQLTVDDMVFRERIDWESWVLAVRDEVLSGAVEEEGRDWFKLDLGIDADKTVRVRNNVGDFTASGSLRVVGDTAHPGLLGRVRAVPGGRVYLKEREFELQRGELRFVDPFTFDPELDFSLTTLVETTDQQYRIDAQVGGTWSDWHTTTRSDPNLAQADVNALLVFGMTREEMERTGALGRALAVEGSDVLFSSIGIVERAQEGIFHLHGLQPLLNPLRPERLDLVSGTSERGSATVSSELRLLYENDLADLGWRGGTLVFEQNVAGGRDTYLGLEQRLARRLYLRGFWASQQEERSLKIGGAFGIEVNLRWEL
ncbi:MAG: hypothetical protein GXP62_21780, partial [Oligoflexia bacterium]|nr:hypothetical protein [Oligoflexia bacterium]